MGTYKENLLCSVLTISTLLVIGTNAGNLTESESVQLVHGETPHEGRVEMYIEDEGGWLPVLYYRPSITGGVPSWNFMAADIACREIGYPGALSHGKEDGALSGDPRRRITSVQCSEEDVSLLDCDYEFMSSLDFEAAATVKCNFIDCGDPGEVANADRVGTEYSYNSNVTYICHDGYYIIGNDVVHCAIEGNWTQKPSCHVIQEYPMSTITPETGSHVKIGTIVGIVSAVVAVAVVMVIVVLCVLKRKPGRKRAGQDHKRSGNFSALRELEGDETMAYEEIPDDVEKSSAGVARHGDNGKNISQYEKIDPRSRFEHQYTGLQDDSKNRREFAAANDEEYQPIDPSLVSDSMYCGLQQDKDNSSDQGTEQEETATGKAYESLRRSLQSDQTYTGLNKDTPHVGQDS